MKKTNYTIKEQIESKIKTIAIAGHSGAGKSTVAGMLLEKLPNAQLLPLDLPFIAAPLKFKEEYERIFNLPLDVNDHINCLRVAMDSNPVALRNYIKLITPFLDEEISKEKEKIASRTKGTTDTKYLITDFFGFPNLSYWTKADYRIMVDAPNKQERNVRLVEREKNDTISKFWSPLCGEIREEAIGEMIANAKGIDFHISNAFDEQLAIDVQGICDTISNKI